MILAPQVSAPPLIWTCITHAYFQGHPRLNLDIVSYNMLGVDSDGCWSVPPGMGLQVIEGEMFTAAPLGAPAVPHVPRATWATIHWEIHLVLL